MIEKIIKKIKALRSKYCSAKRNDDLLAMMNNLNGVPVKLKPKLFLKQESPFALYKRLYPKRKKYARTMDGASIILKDLKQIEKGGVAKARLDHLAPFGYGYDQYNMNGTVGTLGPGGLPWRKFYKLENGEKKQLLWQHWILKQKRMAYQSGMRYRQKSFSRG